MNKILLVVFMIFYFMPFSQNFTTVGYSNNSNKKLLEYNGKYYYRTVQNTGGPEKYYHLYEYDLNTSTEKTFDITNDIKTFIGDLYKFKNKIYFIVRPTNQVAKLYSYDAVNNIYNYITLTSADYDIKYVYNDNMMYLIKTNSNYIRNLCTFDGSVFSENTNPDASLGVSSIFSFNNQMYCIYDMTPMSNRLGRINSTNNIELINNINANDAGVNGFIDLGDKLLINYNSSANVNTNYIPVLFDPLTNAYTSIDVGSYYSGIGTKFNGDIYFISGNNISGGNKLYKYDGITPPSQIIIGSNEAVLNITSCNGKLIIIGKPQSQNFYNLTVFDGVNTQVFNLNYYPLSCKVVDNFVLIDSSSTIFNKYITIFNGNSIKDVLLKENNNNFGFYSSDPAYFINNRLYFTFKEASTTSSKFDIYNIVYLTDNILSSTNYHLEEGIKIYGCDIKNQFMIISKENSSLSLYNSVGQKIENILVYKNVNKTIDLNKLTKGIYFISGVVSNKVYSKKLIIE